MIGHGVVMESNKKMTGCLQTYGGHCRSWYYLIYRQDGPTSKAITLPTDRAFVLLRRTQQCQSVYGMVVTDLFVRWDDNDDLNSDERDGMHPYDDGGPKDHKLYFCHYRPTTSGEIIVG